MNISIIDIIETIKILEKKYPSLLEIDIIREDIKNKLTKFNRKKFRELYMEDPFIDYNQYLKNAEIELKNEDISLKKIDKDLEVLLEVANEIGENYEEFYNHIQRLKELNYDMYLIREEILFELKKLLDNAYQKWIDNKKKEIDLDILDDINLWLSKLDKIYSFFKKISLSDKIIFNIYSSNLEIENLNRFLKKIENNEFIKELLLFFKRMKQVESAPKEVEYKEVLEVYTPEVSSKNELDIIKLSDDIKNILPDELMILAEDDLSKLFDLKFFEKRLMCFDLENLAHVFETDKVEENLIENKNLVISIEAKKNDINTIKFISLYLINRAYLKDDNIYLHYIDENLNLKSFNLSKGFSLESFLDFIDAIFYKDTQNPFITIKESLRDSPHMIFYLTDFIVDFVNEDIINQIVEYKNSHRINIYDILVRDKVIYTQDYKIFDNELIYKPKERLQKLKYFIEKFI